MKFISEADLNGLAEEVLAWSNADVSMVYVKALHRSHLRYANLRVLSSGELEDIEIQVRSRFGNRVGVSVTNQRDQASLKGVVKQSEFIAKSSPEDKEMARWPRRLKEEQTLKKAIDLTDTLDPEFRAMKVSAAAQTGIKDNFESSGYLEVNSERFILKSSQGLKAFSEQSAYQFTASQRSLALGAASWAADSGDDLSQANFATTSQRALNRAVMASTPIPIEPGPYTVILEPEALAPLIFPLLAQLNAERVSKGDSYFAAENGRGDILGQNVFNPRVTLYADPNHPLAPAKPWTEDGLGLRRVPFIDQGKLKNFWLTPNEAMKARRRGPYYPSNLIMAGREQSLEAMIAETKQGLLVTRLWQVRPSDKDAMVFTGETRDGVFLIEDGKIKQAVNDLRFQMSLPDLLRQVSDVGQEKRVVSRFPMVLPYLKVNDFNFTSGVGVAPILEEEAIPDFPG